MSSSKCALIARCLDSKQVVPGANWTASLGTYSFYSD
jgi:hypothetical protein